MLRRWLPSHSCFSVLVVVAESFHASLKPAAAELFFLLFLKEVLILWFVSSLRTTCRTSTGRRSTCSGPRWRCRGRGRHALCPPAPPCRAPKPTAWPRTWAACSSDSLRVGSFPLLSSLRNAALFHFQQLQPAQRESNHWVKGQNSTSGEF